MNSAALYHLPAPLTLDQLDTLAEIPEWTEDGAKQPGHIGLCAESFGRVGNEAVTLTIRRSDKKPPASAVQRAKAEITRSVEDKAARRAKLEAVTAELIRQTPASHQDIELIVSPNLIIIGNRSAARCDDVLGVIRGHLGGLNCIPFTANDSLATVAKQLVSADGLALDNVELGDKITAEDEEGGRIVLNGRHYSDNLLTELKAAETVKQARVVWGDFEAVIHDDWTLSQINSPIELIHGTNEYDNTAMQRAAELFYLHTNLPRMLRDIAAHAGGLSHEEARQ